MLKTIKNRLESGETSPPVISEDPAEDKLQELLNNHDEMTSGFFKKVYETDQHVVKVPSYPGAMEGAEQQLSHFKDENIGAATNIGFHDLTLAGYGPDTPVAVQEKYDSDITDISNSQIDQFLDGAINTIDTALQNDVVLQDAKITNFGMFEDEVKYIDITDKESLVAFNPPEYRSPEENRAFMGKASYMYDAFARTSSQQTRYSREQMVNYVTQHSSCLDGDIEIELPEHSHKTGLEQRLCFEVTGRLESTY